MCRAASYVPVKDTKSLPSTLKMRYCWSTVLRIGEKTPQPNHKKPNLISSSTYTTDFLLNISNKSHELPPFFFQDITPEYSYFIRILQEPNTRHLVLLSSSWTPCSLPALSNSISIPYLTHLEVKYLR